MRSIVTTLTVSIALMAVVAPAASAAPGDDPSARAAAGGAGDAAAAAPRCGRLANRLMPFTGRVRRTPRRLRRFMGAFDARCFDFTRDGRRDVAFAIASGGSGGAFDWAVFKRTPARGGRLARRYRKVGERHVDDGHLRLRRRGRRIVVTEPIYRRRDPNCCPTGGRITRVYRVTARRVIRVRTIVRRSSRVARSPRPVAPAQSCTERSNVQAIIDDSGSMSSSDPTELRRTGLELFIRTQGNQSRGLGAVEFGSTAGTVFAPGLIGPNSGTMIGALRGAISDDGGQTNYNDAFARAGADNPGADARIFLTDGGHNVGDYANAHAPGPPTYVVGLDIGSPSPSDLEASRLAQIAAETGGRYFPNVDGTRIQSVFNTISAIVGCRPVPRAIQLPAFRRQGQSRDRRYRPSGGARGISLVLNWGDPRNRFRVIDVTALGPRGRRLATLRRRGRGRRIAFDRFAGTNFDVLTVRRVRGQVRLLIRIRARSLRGGAEAPLLQAGDLLSLQGLQLRKPRSRRRRDAIGSWPAGRGAWSVFLASKRNKRVALRFARRAVRRGLPRVGLLRSGRHESLIPGYWVTFTGVLSRREAIGLRTRARRAGFSDAYASYVSPPRRR